MYETLAEIAESRAKITLEYKVYLKLISLIISFIKKFMYDVAINFALNYHTIYGHNPIIFLSHRRGCINQCYI